MAKKINEDEQPFMLPENSILGQYEREARKERKLRESRIAKEWYEDVWYEYDADTGYYLPTTHDDDGNVITIPLHECDDVIIIKE